jgi:hypothetical protein
MKTKLSLFAAIMLYTFLNSQLTYSQTLGRYSFKVVNMMPNNQSNETWFDSETNIAVNPTNRSNIVGSAFTSNATGSTTSAPIYVSTDGGLTWLLNNIVPSGNGMTGDISIGYGASSGMLYTGILRGGSNYRTMLLRTGNPSGSTIMDIIHDRNTIQTDQPYVSSTTANDASGNARDRLFVGVNFYGNRIANAGDGLTAQVMFSNDASGSLPVNITDQTIEARNTFEEDMPAIRTAIHNSGVVYAIYYNWRSGNPTSERCDVIVVRDDNFASGTNPFTSLNDAADGLNGQRVVTNRLVPAFGVNLGRNRLVASNLTIAVDPNNSANVFIGWCDRVGTNDYTLHFRRSTNSGQTWGTADWLTITNATNPGIAIAVDGKVGLLYQQLTGSGTSLTWETHFRSSSVSGSTFTDDILSSFLDSDLASSLINPSLGDYLDMEAVGNTFYGVFPASNRPIATNFPHSVTYRRNADFTTNQLRNLTNTSNVNISVDPFFFKISPNIINICQIRPDICRILYIDKYIIKFPPWPCLHCPPDPCLFCPPDPCLVCSFQIPMEQIYEALVNTGDNIILKNPYFHLFIGGFDPKNYDIKVVTREGEPIGQELNKTEKGYTISFHTSKNNYNKKVGIHDLDLMIMAKNVAAAKKGIEFSYNLRVSDYRFNEFEKMNK